MRRNGMCPICYLKQIFTPNKRVSSYNARGNYSNSAAMTPPMGWSSWNSFRNHIDEDLILDTARAMKEKKLIEAGYNYINLDDNWHSNMRDENNNLQGDLSRFPNGIASLAEKVNAMGLKLGIYSSNGDYTCEDLPASLGNEWKDAYTVANWGVEFFKYDFCHNRPITVQAPMIESITISPIGKNDETIYPCTDAFCDGTAKIMADHKLPLYQYVMKDKAFVGKHISGLDKALGKATFKNIYADENGEYILTIVTLKKGKYEKFLIADVNGEEYYHFDIPEQTKCNYTARFQQKITLKKGINTIELSNPVHNRADSARIQYTYMGNMLKKASKQVAKEKNQEEKPIVFSICEWGKNQPYLWGAEAGNMWRTTGDIQTDWKNIMWNYDHTVNLYKYAGVGHWNDPDMLEVGRGDFTEEENKSHFSLWCMMSAPLILGNDLRKIDDSTLKIVTNKSLIAIDQDSLAKPAKRIQHGKTDILVKPLSNNRTAICFFNRSKKNITSSIKLSTLEAEKYISFKEKPNMTATEQWSGKTVEFESKLTVTLPPHGCEVYIIG